jgi:hypothetical protein
LAALTSGAVTRRRASGFELSVLAPGVWRPVDFETGTAVIS